MNLKTHLLFFSIGIFLSISSYTHAQNTDFEALSRWAVKRYTALEIVPLSLSYKQNIGNIQPKKTLIQQASFFKQLDERLASINKRKLNAQERLDYDLLAYESQLNLERIALERQWDSKYDLSSSNSLYELPNGKDWYAYFLKKWVDINAEPDAIFELGIEEIQFVKTNMERLQQVSGLNPQAFEQELNKDRFLIHDAEQVQALFEQTKEIVAQRAHAYFPLIGSIPDIRIQRGTDSTLAQVPAFYRDGVFYYNLFDRPFNTRQVGWIYLHEAIPGHHYQNELYDQIARSEVQELFRYMGYIEGWGAYVEYLGGELGAYPDIYQTYGKWEWDMIRSVRLCLDVGLNYYGWTDEKALSFWQEHISDLDHIATREIARMKRWPAQVVTYKYGAKKMLELKEEASKKKKFNIKNFHRYLLQHGDIPISLLEEYVKSVKV